MRVVSIACLALLMAPAAASAQAPGPAADSAWSRGDRAAARSLYLACLEEDRTDAVALFRLGLIASWDGRTAESIAWFDRLLAIHPADRDARLARARAVALAGDLEAAIATTDSILREHPDEPGALVARARLADRERDPAAAERLWRLALAHDPGNVEARTGLAGTLRRQGRVLAARAQLRLALQASPDDPDTRAASDHTERLLRPRIRSSITIEDDSDGNAVATLAAGASFRVTDRLEIRADSWTRRAELDFVATGLTAGAAVIGALLDARSGWTFAATFGAAGSNTPGSAASTVMSAAVTSPAHRATIVSIAAAQTPLDYTLPLVRNRVVMTEATASLAHRAGRDWDFGAAAGAGRFAVGGSGQENRRLAVGAGARRRLTDRWAVAAGARLHGFDRDIDGGFFDPDLYALVDASLLWNTESPWWLLDAEIAPGVQRIGSDGTTSAAIRAAAAATWRLRPGRQIAVRGTFANAGFQQLTADSRGAYRYASIAISLEWWF